MKGGGVYAAVNIPDLEDLVTKAVEAAVRDLESSEMNYPRRCKIWKIMLLNWKPALKLWSWDKKVPTMNSPIDLKIMTFERP